MPPNCPYRKAATIASFVNTMASWGIFTRGRTMAYSIIQWGSGNVGSQAIAAIAQRRDLKLKGLFVYSQDKVGRDAGEIAGIGTVGVKATNNVEKILALDADCVIHSPLSSLVYGDDPQADLKTICALLASGKNVISTVGYMYPRVYGARVMNRLARACRRGGSSFHGTGANPGWLGDLVPLTMSALSGRVDQIVIQEISNFEHYPSAPIILDTMRFGSSPARFKQQSARYSGWLTGLFRESIQMVADGIGLTLTSIDTRCSRALAPRDLQVAAGLIPKGSIAGQRWEWAGTVNGKKRIVHETIWRVHDTIADHWPRGGHSITIKGQPNMYLEFGHDWNDNPGSTTSMHAVNAVPYVCAAPSGIQTFLDLPWIMGRGSAYG
jgi:2,4-diaminopentanoate dehydrogenase